MQAEPGETTDRRSAGTRAATTFRNEPSTRPGANPTAASATPDENLCGGLGWA